MKKILDFFKTTSDDWCPNYPNDTVLITFGKRYDLDGNKMTKIFIIGVFGKDDIYMTKSFSIDKEKEAYDCIISLLKISIITFDCLKSMGFD